MDQRVVFDRVTRASFLVRIAGQFVGYGVDPHEVPTMQQWLSKAAFHALDRFVQPLTELPKQQRYWAAEVTSLINPVFAENFRAQGSVQIDAVEVLPAAPTASLAPPSSAQPTTPSSNAPPVTVVPRPSEQGVTPPRVPPVVPSAASTPGAPVVAPTTNDEPVLDGPAVALDPWELELRPIVDPPTSVTVRPTVTVAYTGPALTEPRLSRARELAADCVATVIERECQQGRSVLDLLLFAVTLTSAVNERFEREAPSRARVRGAIAVRDLRLTQEDAARLRDLYGQIAAARGG